MLREARRRAGLSQRALAERAKVPQPAIARLEAGRVVPRVDTLDRLLEACGEGLYAQARMGIGVDRTLAQESLTESPTERMRVAEDAAVGAYRMQQSARLAPRRVLELGPPVRAEIIISALVHRDVRFILIGGQAAVAHGSPMSTRDVDICFERDPENCERLARVLKELNARLRGPGVPDNLPDFIDARFLANGDHFTFATDVGDFDCMMTPTGVEGGFRELDRNAVDMDLFGYRVRVCGLEDLIRMKRAAGRAKDRAALEELGVLQEEIDERRRRGQKRD